MTFALSSNSILLLWAYILCVLHEPITVLCEGILYTVKTGLLSISVPQTVPLQIPDMLI